MDATQTKYDSPEELILRLEELQQTVAMLESAHEHHVLMEETLTLNEFRLEALLKLNQMTGASLREVTDFALEQAVLLTQSQIGYLAFVNDEETVLTMHAWSQSAMRECQVVDKPFEYPLEKTGLWGEAIRQRKPIITNDYAADNPYKKGMPHGHVGLTRHMNVPVFDGEKIVAVAGVGNKETPYDESDVRQLTLLAEGMWKIIQRHSYEEELVRHRDHLEDLVAERSREITIANEELKIANESLQTQISQRILAEEEIVRQRDRMQAYLNIAGTIILALDPNGYVTLLNKKGCEVLGYDEGELDGKDWFEVCVPQELLALRKRLFNGVLHGDAGCEYAESLVVTKSGERRIVAWHHSAVKNEMGEVVVSLSSGEDITERKRLENALRKTQCSLDNAPDAVFWDGARSPYSYVNEAALAMTEYSREELLRMTVKDLDSEFDLAKWKAIQERILENGSSTFEGTIRTKTGKIVPIEICSTRIHFQDMEYAVSFVRDVTQRKHLEQELSQSHKLEAVGQLAAGIAHEINTPVQFISDNTRFLQDAFRDMQSLCGAFHQMLEFGKCGRAAPAALVETAEGLLESVDYAYLSEEIPKAITQSLDGLEVVAKIVGAMKEFSHPGSQNKQAVDLNRALQNTATVCRNEWKYLAELETDLDPTLPLVPCHPSDLNQVFLNMIVNAAHAVHQVGGGEDKLGHIAISTRLDGDWVEIRFKDDGCGIPQEIREKIYDPFFTTKDVGKGSGQGLSIARSVIVDKHAGMIRFETEVGRGTTFIIRLPLKTN